MNILCRVFGHLFRLSMIDGADDCWISCKRCMLYETVCRNCHLLGYEEGIGNRQIPCEYGPHKVVLLEQGKRKTHPRGYIVVR